MTGSPGAEEDPGCRSSATGSHQRCWWGTGETHLEVTWAAATASWRSSGEIPLLIAYREKFARQAMPWPHVKQTGGHQYAISPRRCSSPRAGPASSSSTRSWRVLPKPVHPSSEGGREQLPRGSSPVPVVDVR